MLPVEMIQMLVDYHLDITQRVWDLIEQTTDQQFTADDNYSRGSVRNLMVHLANTAWKWLAVLENKPEPSVRNYQDYPTRESARALWNEVAQELSAYAQTLNESNLSEAPEGETRPRWQILVHLVNHGTDHRATMLQRLYEFGAPTFDQDFIMWKWAAKE